MHRAQIRRRSDGTVETVAVVGEIDLTAHDELHAAIHDALAVRGTRSVVVDLTTATLLDSGGIGVLVAGRNAARRQHTGFTVTGASGMVATVVQVTGVWSTLTGLDDPDAPADA